MPPEQAAQLTDLHVEHHLRLGFAGYSVFLTPDYFAAFARHPRLAKRIASGQVGGLRAALPRVSHCASVPSLSMSVLLHVDCVASAYPDPAHNLKTLTVTLTLTLTLTP